jgi:hypothetical protein
LSAARDVLDGHDSQAPRGRRGATQTGPSKDASGAGRVQAAVEPGVPASTAPPRPSPSTRRKPARRRTRAKADRTVEDVPAGKLELLLSDTGGLATSALAVWSSADRDQVLTLLRELETAGRVCRTGQRRATRWHAITDEERIQGRAAELASRSRSAARRPDRQPVERCRPARTPRQRVEPKRHDGSPCVCHALPPTRGCWVRSWRGGDGSFARQAGWC